MVLRFCLPGARGRWLGGVALLVSLAAGGAHAELGGSPLRPAASTGAMPVARAAAQPGGNGTGSALAAYATVVQQLPTGTVLTEYTDSAGVVFALSWTGPRPPDMGAVLGSYFPAFVKQAQATRGQRGIRAPLSVADASLVVFSAGQLRHFFGHAYAPALVPSGLDIRNVFP